MKYFKWITGLSVFLVILLLILAHFPRLLVPKQFSYSQFHVYSPKKIILDEEVIFVLDSVQAILEQSDFYAKEQEHHLYFVHQSNYESIIRLIGRKNMAFSMHGNMQIYSAIPDFKKRIIHRNDNDIEKMAMLQVFPHEAVHNQMRIPHSNFSIPTTPYWLNEGYCEFVSYAPIRSDENYSFPDLWKALQENDDYWVMNSFAYYSPRDYIEYRLIMEYLILEKGMDIEQIIQEDIQPDVIRLEINNIYL